MKKPFTTLALLLALTLLVPGHAAGAKDKKKQGGGKDPYADIVWPPPPEKARIKLDKVIYGRSDVVARSKFRKKLLGSSPQAVYDELQRPFDVAIDGSGRFLVSDSTSQALIRYDLSERKMDVFGTTGPYSLVFPMGVHVAADETIYVADGRGGKVVAYDDQGEVVGVFGDEDDFERPVDVAVTPDGTRLLVVDILAHQILVLSLESGEIVDRIGSRGTEDGEFNFPRAVDFGPEGNLFVVDGENARIQVFDPDFEFIDKFGERGAGFGQFTRPKDIAVDEVGLIYVTDFAFNNFQLFDIDFTLLTFVGAGGTAPGAFQGPSGIAVRGDTIAVVDSLSARLQVFRFIVPKDE